MVLSYLFIYKQRISNLPNRKTVANIVKNSETNDKKEETFTEGCHKLHTLPQQNRLLDLMTSKNPHLGIFSLLVFGIIKAV